MIFFVESALNKTAELQERASVKLGNQCVPRAAGASVLLAVRGFIDREPLDIYFASILSRPSRCEVALVLFYFWIVLENRWKAIMNNYLGFVGSLWVRLKVISFHVKVICLRRSWMFNGTSVRN